MHSPKQSKKKTPLAIHTKLSMCRVSYQECPDRDGLRTVEEGENQRRQTAFLNNAED
ncbi:unnamed protein product [Staurois parvus]|uniref:Uncharacterized protein n=1 Tax=Staurois parvus TaxID=386267 RepID=A0ABN9FV74_9NEOB|nr:unnamed protein product [Staurois parvus]